MQATTPEDNSFFPEKETGDRLPLEDVNPRLQVL